MALNIKSPKADRLARELAKATGESITEAVIQALEERLQRQQQKDAGKLHADLNAMVDRCRGLKWRDDISNEEAAGYNELGTWD